MAIDVTQQLLASGDKYRPELLAMPLLQLETYLKHMSMRIDVRGEESVGTIGSGAELRPYKTAKGEKDTSSIAMRTLKTYLGDVLEEMDPHQIAATVYGNQISRKPTEFDIVKAVAMEMAKVVGNKLRSSLFTAKRDANGNTTKSLFDGFSTIVDQEIVSGGLATAKGNFAEVDTITAANVVDILRDLYNAASEELQEQDTKLFLPTNIYNLYKQGYLAEFGAVAYNTQYQQTYLIDSDNKCEIVPISAMSGTGQLILTTKSNMLVGVDQMSDTETVRIRECDNPKVVQYFMKMYFGTQLESLENQRLMVAKIKAGS